MKPGDMTDVIQIEQAFTIIRLNAHTTAGKKKFEEVRSAACQGTTAEENESASRTISTSSSAERKDRRIVNI